jgi:AAA+ ATPase superfamily predicted ATPase
MIISREKELLLLNQIFASSEAEFVAVYGRRRIGKTFLIESYFQAQECLFFHMVGVQKGTLSGHLKEFAKEVSTKFYGKAKLETPVDWMAAFEMLNEAMKICPGESPIILFFDEFPWLATKRSRILEALEYYWNKYWKSLPRVKLIVCGSSASWIIKKILHNKGGLHNRTTQQIHLKPFDLSGTKAFLESKGMSLTQRQVLEIYFVFGGVPYYLKQVKKSLSVAENIGWLCFSKDGPLFNEFDKLFSSLFRDSNSYEELVRFIASCREGVSREKIIKNIKQTQQGGTLSARLSDLEMAGFIQSFLPIGQQKKGLYYRVVDEFSIFYLAWIEQNKSGLSLDSHINDFWPAQINTPKYHAWCGYAFESLCYKHIGQIKNALEIQAGSRTGTWRYVPKDPEDQGAQIDLLFDRMDDAMTLCEIKCTKDPYVLDKEGANELIRRVQIFKGQMKTQKQIFVALISANGAAKTKYLEEVVAKAITLEDLIKPLGK